MIIQRLWHLWYSLTNGTVKLSRIIDTSEKLPLLKAIQRIHSKVHTFNRPIDFSDIILLDIETDFIHLPSWEYDFTTLDLKQLRNKHILLSTEHPRHFHYDGPRSLIIHKHGLALASDHNIVELDSAPNFTHDETLNLAIKQYLENPVYKD